jgi:hypothetical protein
MAQVQYATLVASTVTTLTFTDGKPRVEVFNRTGTAEIFFTVDGSTPTVGGTNCQMIPAAIQGLTVDEESTGNTVLVKIISTGTPTVSARTF